MSKLFIYYYNIGIKYLNINLQGDVELLKIATIPDTAYELCTKNHAPDCPLGVTGSRTIYNSSWSWSSSRGRPDLDRETERTINGVQIHSGSSGGNSYYSGGSSYEIHRSSSSFSSSGGKYLKTIHNRP